MKKNMLTLLIAAVLFAFQSCNRISGDGPVTTKTLNLSNFTTINSGLDGDVYFTQDNVYKVEIEAQSNILEEIETPVINGTINLQFKKFKNIGHHSRIMIHISCPIISGLEVNGSGSLYVSQAIAAQGVDLRVNGSGYISISSFTGSSLNAHISGSGRIAVNGGLVNTEDLHISGSGTLDLLHIPGNYVTTHTSGSGNTSVNAVTNLDVHISGSGDVYYTGNPAVNSSISGSGKLHHQ